VSLIKKFKVFNLNQNEDNRGLWLEKTLSQLNPGLRILDAGAGELRNKPLCKHLVYVSQDICQYEGNGDSMGLQMGKWDTSNIDLVCDLTNIPEVNASFDVVLCSEVFEHIPDPLLALKEFSRLLKPGGKLIITAPFASFVHFAPYHFSSGFSKYWYEHHLPEFNFELEELSANGDWFSYMRQEMIRLPSMARRYNSWHWPFAYVMGVLGAVYFSFVGASRKSDDVACFGWHCIAVKN
jgi:ubiquinone/menaquinone biosynthesis C-methylase UbiE